MMTIEELKDEIDGIKNLLDDPHPGVFSWHELLRNRVNKLVALWLSLLIILCAFTLNANAQLPNAPSFVAHEVKTTPRNWKVLYANDIAIRALDAKTTYSFMNDPCKCYHETDPIAPKGKSLGPMIAFQAANVIAVYAGSEFLRRHHQRLAAMLVSYDIINESNTVKNNMQLH